MTNLDSILKSRDITLPTKFCLIKAMVFPVVMYGYKCWTIKKAEHGRNDAFQMSQLIVASSPITSWQVDGETMKTVRDYIFLGSKITADDDFSHEIKRLLFLGRKVMTCLDSILESRDITLPTKFRLVKAMAFPVVM